MSPEATLAQLKDRIATHVRRHAECFLWLKPEQVDNMAGLNAALLIQAGLQPDMLLALSNSPDLNCNTYLNLLIQEAICNPREAAIVAGAFEIEPEIASAEIVISTTSA